MEYAGFWRRVAASMIDTVPLTIGVTAVFLSFPAVDRLCQYLDIHPNDAHARLSYLVLHSLIDVLPFLLWLILCTLLEPTRLHGSFGKFILHLKVLDENLQPITFKRALVRNATKIVSVLALDIGFLWAAFTERGQTWHDIFAETVVMWDPEDEEEPKER